ncbi:MAG: carboxypeptidase regulatory-like domain-containing protein [Deltaproteobacteria bacterium]|nr:carboxypeptidase regulatory-like domain-containing protein [Deltaproteobacteria bacterium]
MTINLNTPGKRIRAGFIVVNRQFIRLRGLFSTGALVVEREVRVKARNRLWVLLVGERGLSITIEIRQKGVISPPQVKLTAEAASIFAGESSTLTWSSTNADYGVIEPGIGTVDTSGSIVVSPYETTTYTITVAGPGGTATARVTVIVKPAVPTVSLSANPGTIQIGDSATLSWASSNAVTAHIDNGIGAVSLAGSSTVHPSHTTTYTITVAGTNGSTSAKAVLTVTGNPEPQPEGSFGEQYQDLVPADATVESYESRRFSLITGAVRDLGGSPIPDVSVTILDSPEYGTATTGANGRFSLPVEGGGTMTVVFEKEGLITSHRKTFVPCNDIAIVKTVQMITEDPTSTTVTLDGNPETVITYETTKVADEFGSRSCTVVFKGDNRAYLVDENGNDIHELTTIAARATEFTTPDSMPAILPPNSAYTYCVELMVDGIQRVRFDEPVFTWVDNFLEFEVGEIIPVGYYDRDEGVWVPSDNGVVVRLLDTNLDGTVDALDANGDDSPDDLNNNGSFSDEVAGLENSLRYPPGATFWRVAVTHFTPWDFNWPYGPPGDAIPPNPEGVPYAEQQKTEEKICRTASSSFVDDRSRIFHEDIPIPGTDITLHYASNGVKGYNTSISVPVSGARLPNSLKRIVAKVEVAGRAFEQILDPLPNQKADFVWDGFDHLGRAVQAPTIAHASIGFVYDQVYYSGNDSFEQAFGQAGDDLTATIARQELISWRQWDVAIYPFGVNRKRRGFISDGWTISHHHHLSPIDPSTLHKGDGTIARSKAGFIDTVAGNGTPGYSGDGGPAHEAQLNYVQGLHLDASGNLYIADRFNHSIRKVDTAGNIGAVAGNGLQGYSGDGGPATEASLSNPFDIAVDASGNLYIADWGNKRVRKVDTNGIITTVAGNGSEEHSGDNGPAIWAAMNPFSLALDISGNLYVGDATNSRVRKVDTNGVITTVAGNGTAGYSGDGGPATEAMLYGPRGLAVDSFGNIYICDYFNSRIRKVDPTGIITTIAGNGVYGYSGDGGPATEASIYAFEVTVDQSGNIYIADTNNHCIRKVDTNGIITTVAGTNSPGYSGDGRPAIEAELGNPQDLAVDVLGNLYISDTSNHRVRIVAPPFFFAGRRAAADISFAEGNGLGHVFSSAGYHKSTIDLDSRATMYNFSYDRNNNLVLITDRFGNQTLINRDLNDVPTSIISPDGITTTLTVDVNNHLTRIAYPDGSSYSFEYTSNGLMTAKVESEGNRFEHLFDAPGRLTDATDQEGGHWQFLRTAYENGDVLTEVLTAEGNLTSYLDHIYSTGEYTSEITDPTGTVTFFTESGDGMIVHKSLPCGMELEFKYGVDPEYKFKVVKEMREITPSALGKKMLREKSYQDTNLDDVPDLIAEIVTVNGKATALENDILLSQKTIISPEGRTVTTLYDPATLLPLSLSIPGLYDTTYGYDTRGRLTSIKTNTRQTSFVYNTQGFLQSITGPENHNTYFSYDGVGRVTGINRPDGTSIGFTYDGNGNVRVLTNPSSIAHTFGYNLVNLNNSYQTPLSSSYTYVYDRDRRLTNINFPSGKTINNVYDKTRLVQIKTREGNIDLSYLCGTKVDSISTGTESIRYGYDGPLVTSETLGGTLNQSFSYAYNNDFNLQSFNYAGYTHLYTYDNDGLLTGAGSFTIGRNAANGLPETVTGGALNLSRTFNGYGEVESQDFIIHGLSLTSWSLTRDDNGKITNKTETVDGVTSNYVYTYGPMGRLLTVTKNGVLVEEYEYSPNGTRTYEINTLKGIAGRKLTYSDEDHLLTAGATSYQYDLDGCLRSKTESTNVTSYNYSSRGELLGVDLPDGTAIEYIHDPLGRRIAKKVNGITIEKYLWHGLTRLLAVYDGSDNLLMRFEYADARMPVTMTRSDGTYYLTYDQVGSLRMVADATGVPVKLIDYDSFGSIIKDSDPSFEVPFGFAGGLHDRDTGLVRFGFRDYDPDIGRWTSKDPIFFLGGDTDLYGYCLNNPVNWVDPDGLAGFAFDVGGAYGTGWGKTDPGAGSASAGSGFYIGAKEGGYAELGVFTYQSQGKPPGAKIGLGLSFTRYYTDPERFFKGEMKYTSITLGPVTLTKYADPCSKENTGWTLSLLGKGLGFTWFEEGISRSFSRALQ